MKYVKSISLFFVYPLCCFLMGLFIGMDAPDTEEADPIPKEAVTNHSVLVQTKQTPVLQEGYFLKNINNHVVVYQMDQETVFLFTEIYVDQLPEEVQEKLEQGIVMPDEGSLYDFLENYTS